MPFYDFRCPSCDARFEVQRSMEDYDEPMICPNGHDGAVRVLTTWGVTGGGVRYGSPAAAGRRNSTKTVAPDPPTLD